MRVLWQNKARDKYASGFKKSSLRRFVGGLIAPTDADATKLFHLMDSRPESIVTTGDKLSRYNRDWTVGCLESLKDWNLNVSISHLFTVTAHTLNNSIFTTVRRYR